MKTKAAFLVLGLALLLPGQSQALVVEGGPRSAHQRIEEEGPIALRSPEWSTLYTAYARVPKTRVDPVIVASFQTAFRCAGIGSCYLRLVVGDAQEEESFDAGQLIEGNRILIDRSSGTNPLPGPGLYEIRTEIKSVDARFRDMEWSLDIYNFDLAD